MKKAVVLNFLKGLVISYAITAAILAVIAALMFWWDAPEGVVRGGVVLSYVLSSFFYGMIASKNRSGKRFLWGVLAGTAYYAVLVSVSMVCNRMVFTEIPGIWSALFLCLSGGMLGGMMQAGRR